MTGGLVECCIFLCFAMLPLNHCGSPFGLYPQISQRSFAWTFCPEEAKVEGPGVSLPSGRVWAGGVGLNDLGTGTSGATSDKGAGETVKLSLGVSEASLVIGIWVGVPLVICAPGGPEGKAVWSNDGVKSGTPFVFTG
jgi:hypothetical protein